MGSARYAICYAPEQGSTLEAFDRSWFGRLNSKPTASLVPGLTFKRLEFLTTGPRNYGLHGTLKPSFELNPHTTEAALLAVAKIFAGRLGPITLPALELGEIGVIVSFVLTSSSAALEDLQSACVRAFDGYRQPLTNSQEESYKRNRLTVHQDKMLDHWGYPYVMEEFDFHISLTDPVPDEKERAAIMKALPKLAGAVLGKPLVMSEIAVFRQESEKEPMAIIARIPFGRSG